VRSRLLGSLAFVAAFSPVERVLAQDASHLEDAAQAYEAGAALFAKKDYAHAAEFFARADELAPSNVALDEALKSAISGDLPSLGMELVERARTRTISSALAQRVAAAKKSFATRVGKLVLNCPPEAKPCEIGIDGRTTKNPAWVDVGAHAISVRVGPSAETRSITVFPASTTVLDPPPRLAEPVPVVDPPPQPSPTATSGLSPTWFWIGVGVSAASGIATIVSALDYTTKRDAFDADPTEERASSGRAAETRTNVLLVVTGVVVVATAVTGAVFVRWSPAHATVGWAF
jgi:hypothetical protein